MKKLKRDLTKPEKVEVKKTAVKHQDEYPEGPEFEWADYWFEGAPETEVIKGDNLTKILYFSATFCAPPVPKISS